MCIGRGNLTGRDYFLASLLVMTDDEALKFQLKVPVESGDECLPIGI